MLWFKFFIGLNFFKPGFDFYFYFFFFQNMNKYKTKENKNQTGLNNCEPQHYIFKTLLQIMKNKIP